MNLIVAVDRNWAIGNKGQLLVNIPEDQRLFRGETLGKVIVMGRKTLESFPGGQPLYGRTNIVLTHDKTYKVKGAIVCHSVSEVLSILEDYEDEDIFIIGGQSIYEQFLPYCDTAHVTWVDYEYEADTYFPDLGSLDEWILTRESDEKTYFSICYEFRMYQRRALAEEKYLGKAGG